MAGLLDHLSPRQLMAAAFPIAEVDLSAILGPKLRRGTKGSYGRRIIRTERYGGRVFELHATKGWRSYRATGEQ